MSWFVNPWMLAGGAAVASPIVVHFLFKARFRRLPWAAMRFLKEAIQQTTRRVKFQELILLVLRCLVILLLAAALARPKREAEAEVTRGAAVDAVLVMDVSYSMGAPDGTMEVVEDGKQVVKAVTRFDRARAAAVKTLYGLAGNSTVRVLACGGSDPPADLGPANRYSRSDAEDVLNKLRPTGQATDFVPAFAAAAEAARAGTSAREVYLFSDLQRGGFRHRDAARAAVAELRQSARARLVFVRCCKAEDRLKNVAVVDVRPADPFNDPPRVGARVPFAVTVKNTGSVPTTGVQVGLTVGDLQPGDKGAPPGPRDADPPAAAAAVDDLAPGQTATAVLPADLPAAGPRLVTVRLTGDGLPGDNRFDRLVVVRNAIQVLVVDGTPNPADDTKSGSHAVRLALNPWDPRQKPKEAEQFLFEIRMATADLVNANPERIARYDLIVLCNVPVASAAPAPPAGALSETAVKHLARFVENGGGLIIGLGDQVERAVDRPPGGPPTPAYNRLLGSGGARLLPFDLAADAAGKAELKEANAPFVVVPQRTAKDSILGRYLETADAPLMSGVTVRKRFRLREDGPGAAGGRVLMRMNDDRAFVAARGVGAGQVVVVATAFDQRLDADRVQWSTFADRAHALQSFFQIAGKALAARRLDLPEDPVPVGRSLVWWPKSADPRFDLIKPFRPGDKELRVVEIDREPRYQITPRAVTGLRDAEVPADVTGRLAPLADRVFDTGDALAAEVTRVLGPEAAGRWAELILKHAREEPPQGRVVVTDTVDPGVYRITPAGRRDAPGPTFVVNPDPREGEDLDPATDADLKEWLGYEPVVVTAGDQPQPPREWTEWFLVALLVLMVVEAVWAWGCGRTPDSALGRVLGWLVQLVGLGVAGFGAVVLAEGWVSGRPDLPAATGWVLVGVGLGMVLLGWLPRVLKPAAPVGPGARPAV